MKTRVPYAEQQATRRHWVTTIVAYLVFGLALVLVALAAGQRNRAWVGAALVFLLAATIWFGDARRRPGKRARFPMEMALALASLLVALALSVVWLIGSSQVSNALFFAGVSMGVVTLATFLSGMRAASSRTWAFALLLIALIALIVACIVSSDAWFRGLLLVGLVVGEVAIEITSEASNDWKLADHGLICAGVGALISIGAYFAMVGQGVQPAHAIFMLLALGGLVWIAASAADSLVLVLIAALALTWAAAPRGAAPDASIAPTAGAPYFVALGDSYTSGEGAQTFLHGTNTVRSNADRTNECRQAPTAWPLSLARTAAAGTGAPAATSAGPSAGAVPSRVLFLACSGAVAANIDTRPYVKTIAAPAKGAKGSAAPKTPSAASGPAELALYERARSTGKLGAPRFVVLGIGGNDAGFSDIGETCVGPGDCSTVGQQFLDRLRSLKTNLDAAYERVRVEFGSVPVVAVPYPIPLLADGKACSTVLLTGKERTFVVGFVRQLDRVIQQEARSHGFHYMDTMEDALRNRLLCGQTGLRSGLNFLAFNPKEGGLSASLNPANWTHNSLHPNAEGHEAMRQAAAVWFAEHPDLTKPDPVVALTPPTFAVNNISSIRLPQCQPAGGTDCAVARHGWLWARSRHLYRSSLLGFLLALLGSWLVVAPMLWWARRHELTTMNVIRSVRAHRVTAE